MKLIGLTQGKFAKVDDVDYELLSRYSWHAFRHHGRWYARTNVHDATKRHRTVLMHRAILGETDPRRLIDHRNLDGLDNTRENLRICNPHENARNRKIHRNGTSGYKGVTYRASRKRWRAQICVDGKNLTFDGFQSKEDAAKKYDALARKHFGAFAQLNFS